MAPSEQEGVCSDLNEAIDRAKREGFRLDVIYPADDPHTAILSKGGACVRLTSRPDAPWPSAELPPFVPEFVLSRAGHARGEGRAGMLYADLIPSRLGGRYIASHITIPVGGPVNDWVHFHRLVFQMICVRKGWVRVVYEDQGESFVMNEGDLVLQPPGIRHRVLESSSGAEVVEISCPASHETVADHDMALPTGSIDALRDFSGQLFLRHIANEAPWTVWHGGEAQETAMGEATRGLAEARTLRPGSAPTIAVSPHDGELEFGFMLEGSARLDYNEGYPLGPGDAFVVPPSEPWGLREASSDLRLLHVTTGKSA